MTANSELVYSTETGATDALAKAWAAEDDDRAYANQYCAVCGRCTDHVGEHDDLLVQGLCEYDGYDVILTDAMRALRNLEYELPGVLAFAFAHDAEDHLWAIVRAEHAHAAAA